MCTYAHLHWYSSTLGRDCTYSLLNIQGCCGPSELQLRFNLGSPPPPQIHFSLERIPPLSFFSQVFSVLRTIAQVGIISFSGGPTYLPTYSTYQQVYTTQYRSTYIPLLEYLLYLISKRITIPTALPAPPACPACLSACLIPDTPLALRCLVCVLPVR